MEIISRKDAAALNMPKFFTGIACKKCDQVCERYVSNHRCVNCQHQRNIRNRSRVIDRRAEAARRSGRKVYAPPTADVVAMRLRLECGARLIHGRCHSGGM
jgi:hypothetical protein